MDKRLDTSRSGYREDISSHGKKNKKRSAKRSSVFGSWTNNVENEQSSDFVPGMEYQHILWQSGVQQNFQNNGQRLFATTSDPSVCGYTPMPVTYTMEPVSLPTMYRLYQPVPVPGVRSVHGRPRRNCSQTHSMNLGVNTNTVANGYTSLQENGSESPVPINYQNGDYASLPPTANRSNEINGDEPNSEHRRYSDPGLGSAEASGHTQSEDSDSVDSGSSITTIGRSNKLVLSLVKQMTELKRSNSQLFKELSETKSELENIKAKMIQCKHSSSADYQPGMLSDLIREIREANKVCEEVLIAKMKSTMEEKLSQRSSEIDQLNAHVIKLVKEKEETERRVEKLEEEVAMLKLNANNEGREIAAFEEETLALRRELQEARASKNLAENHVANPTSVESHEDPWRVTELGNRAVDSSSSHFVTVPGTNGSDLTAAGIAALFSLEDPNRREDASSTDGTLQDETNATTGSSKNLEMAEDQDSKRGNKSPANDELKVDARKVADGATASVLEKANSSRSEAGKKWPRQDESEEGDHSNPKGNSKKPRRKKTSVKRSYSEADKSAKASSATSSSSWKNILSKDGRRTVSEDEDCFDDDQTSRAITEIPEVTVVGGGSFVPKDLCSTGILTSRVLTAPSRATYTTAYI